MVRAMLGGMGIYWHAANRVNDGYWLGCTFEAVGCHGNDVHRAICPFARTAS